MKKKINIDCDGVLCDFVSETINWAKDKRENCTFENITDFNILKAWGIPELWGDLHKHMSQKGICANFGVLPGAQEFVQELRKYGEIVVVTSPFKNAPYWFIEREEWLEKHFGFSKNDIIFSHNKNRIVGDILIDDAAHNIEEWNGTGILLDCPWNKNCSKGIRCFNYDEILEKVKELVL